MLSRLLIITLLIFGLGVPAAFSAGQTDAGAVVINGRKTFPLGWYALSWYHSTGTAKTLPLVECGQHSWDYAMPYTPFSYGTNQDVINYLNTAQTLGTKVIIDTHGNPVYKITSIVNAVKNHPALYGYYVEDEPEVRNISASEVITKYNAIRNADPNPDHPVLLTLTQPLADNQAYLAAGDIIGRELYKAEQIATIESDIATARALGKNYIAIPRMYQARSAYALTVPTAEEFKYLVFNPISKGAGGIMPFIFEGNVADGYTLPPEGFRDQSVYPVINLLQEVIPTLLKGSSLLNATLDSWDELLHGGDKLSWIIAGDNCDAVLIVVNDCNLSVANMDFTFTGLNSVITKATVVGEGRTISLINGKLSDNFGPYDVHIYKFSLISGDANEDGMVDVGDLGILAANYGGSGKIWSHGDFNGDGLVDVGDLGILAANYGQGSSSTVDFSTDYAKAFGTTVADDTKETSGIFDPACSAIGLPLIAGLMFLGYSKLKE
jgi:hypothetical protein